MRPRYIFAAVFVCVLAVGVGYMIGFRHAWQMGVRAEFAARGVLATHMLRAMRNEKTELVITTLEADVDSGLLIGGDFVESRSRTLLPLVGVTPPADYEQLMSRMASYRKANPRPIETRPADIQATIAERVHRYAK